MNEATRKFVIDLLATYGGNVEATARYMRDSLKIGGLRDCRDLISEALA